MDKEILLSVSRIKKLLDKDFSQDEFLEHHVRISRYKAEYLEEDINELFKIINQIEKNPDNEIDSSASESGYDDFLTKINYILGQDIIENLSFDFLGQQDSNKEIIRIFQQLKELFSKVNEAVKPSSHKIIAFREIIEERFFIVEKEIQLLHSEESAIRKIRRLHSPELKKKEEYDMMLLNHEIYKLFEKLKDSNNYKLAALMGESPSGSPDEKNKSDIILLLQKTAEHPELKSLHQGLQEIKQSLMP